MLICRQCISTPMVVAVFIISTSLAHMVVALEGATDQSISERPAPKTGQQLRSHTGVTFAINKCAKNAENSEKNAKSATKALNQDGQVQMCPVLGQKRKTLSQLFDQHERLGSFKKCLLAEKKASPQPKRFVKLLAMTLRSSLVSFCKSPSTGGAEKEAERLLRMLQCDQCLELWQNGDSPYIGTDGKPKDVQTNSLCLAQDVHTKKQTVEEFFEIVTMKIPDNAIKPKKPPKPQAGTAYTQRQKRGQAMSFPIGVRAPTEGFPAGKVNESLWPLGRLLITKKDANKQWVVVGMCTASVTLDGFVISTAAHCMVEDDVGADSGHVMYFVQQYSDDYSLDTMRLVKAFARPKGFNRKHDHPDNADCRLHGLDFAFLLLAEESLPFPKQPLKPRCFVLPTKPIASYFGQEVTAFGYPNAFIGLRISSGRLEDFADGNTKGLAPRVKQAGGGMRGGGSGGPWLLYDESFRMLREPVLLGIQSFSQKDDDDRLLFINGFSARLDPDKVALAKALVSKWRGVPEAELGMGCKISISVKDAVAVAPPSFHETDDDLQDLEI